MAKNFDIEKAKDEYFTDGYYVHYKYQDDGMQCGSIEAPNDIETSKCRKLVFKPPCDCVYSAEFLIELGELIKLGKRALNRESEKFEKKIAKMQKR
jgi:hypothetical protein